MNYVPKTYLEYQIAKTHEILDRVYPVRLEQLNDIQRQWMAVDSNGPKAEIDRVCKLMDKLPKIYVSGHDGNGVCIVSGSPMSMTVSFAQALEQCKELGGRIDVAWNGTKGEWYAL